MELIHKHEKWVEWVGAWQVINNQVFVKINITYWFHSWKEMSYHKKNMETHSINFSLFYINVL